MACSSSSAGRVVGEDKSLDREGSSAAVTELEELVSRRTLAFDMLDIVTWLSSVRMS